MRSRPRVERGPPKRVVSMLSLQQRVHKSNAGRIYDLPARLK